MNTPPLNVLLIEDNPVDARLIQEFLAPGIGSGFHLEHAGRLSDGLGCLARGRTDIVLLDLSLPDCQGFETFVKVHRESPQVPIIVLSGLADEDLAVKTVQEGAQDYLVKGQANEHALVRALRYGVERRRTEQALATERNRLRALIDALPDHIYLKDVASRFIVVNSALAQFFGAASPDDFIGKSDFDLFPHGLAAQFYEEEQAILRSGQPRVNREAALHDNVRTRRWMLTTKVPLRDDRGAIVGLVGINRDITARRQAEEQLQALNADLACSKQELTLTLADLQRSHEELKATQLHLVHAEKMESIARLAAGVAHEVKNPLATILMGLDYLGTSTRPDDNTAQMVLAEMRDAVERADAIVRGLLDFSSPGRLDREIVDLDSVINRALLLVRHDLGQHHVRVLKQLSASPVPVSMDRGKIEQVFVNLFLNAIQAMPEGGELTVRTARRAAAAAPGASRDAVVAEVLDSGPGIPQDQLAKLYEPFFTTKPGVGTGLGLAVAKSIVELHQGKLTLANRPTGGLCATVEFII